MARKKKPVGWKGEPFRHGQSARGIKTAKTPAERKELREGTLAYLKSLEEEPLVVIEEKPRPDDLFRIRERKHVIPQPVTDPPKKLVLDFSKAESVDTEEMGGTAYYGGTVTVNGVEVEIHGSDRSTSFGALLIPEIEKQLGRVITDDEREEVYELTDGARHSPFETHLPAVVEWQPRWRSKKKETYDAKKAKQWSAAQHYVLSLGGVKGKYAHEYLNYYVAKGPRPDQPRRLSVSDMVTVQMRIKAFF